ncbi:hypothetical protein [Clostridium celatum]|uniref:hypothetical protein n=1 Tax=Clostridium celatum TaxID=36834 RepID=UPI0018999895|nr:hypothetical protein [Clostridium celatum]
MDKFDDYLEKQSKCEKEKFVLPQSFDRKVEDILLNLDSELKKENNKWYKNKKLWTTAACFAFICLAGMGLSKQIHLGKNEKKQTTVASEESMMKSAGVRENESNVTHDIESYGLKESGLDNIEDSQVLRADDIYNITIESISTQTKYKEVTKKEDINNIVNFINTMPIYEVINENINSVQYSIKIHGVTDHIYSFNDDIMGVDGIYYRTVEKEISELNELYNNLNYEEKFID